MGRNLFITSENMVGISISVLVSLKIQIFLEVLEGRQGLGWGEKKGRRAGTCVTQLFSHMHNKYQWYFTKIFFKVSKKKKRTALEGIKN